MYEVFTRYEFKSLLKDLSIQSSVKLTKPQADNIEIDYKIVATKEQLDDLVKELKIAVVLLLIQRQIH